MTEAEGEFLVVGLKREVIKSDMRDLIKEGSGRDEEIAWGTR